MLTSNNEPIPRLRLKKSVFYHWWKRSVITIASVTAGLILISPVAQAAVHTVVPGETLWNISQRYDTTVDHIKSLNNLQEDRLQPGQILTVPDNPVQTNSVQAAAITVETKAEPESTQNEICHHIVQSGDTLYGIAIKYNVSVETIMNANNLSATLIHPGQTLIVPTAAAKSDAEIQANKEQTLTSRGGGRADNDVVNIAKAYLGTPYCYGGSGPSNFDCSGFTAYVCAQVGKKLPHNAAAQYGKGQPIAKSELQPGDLVFFGYYGGSSVQHVGIYVGGNNFIHASSGAGVVKQDSLAENYYFNNYKGARRL